MTNEKFHITQSNKKKVPKTSKIHIRRRVSKPENFQYEKNPCNIIFCPIIKYDVLRKMLLMLIHLMPYERSRTVKTIIIPWFGLKIARRNGIYGLFKCLFLRMQLVHFVQHEQRVGRK